ncbi:unnamed protein product [Arabis nemorensis]|uniref:Uncharacterized protein n=1 Tax=Arabis nemorensis TaxID=586526 RepID=A0A565C4S2_9BRAS|nr:unnamed protein product [Arabis nemorensis]
MWNLDELRLRIHRVITARKVTENGRVRTGENKRKEGNYREIQRGRSIPRGSMKYAGRQRDPRHLSSYLVMWGWRWCSEQCSRKRGSAKCIWKRVAKRLRVQVNGQSDIDKRQGTC